MSRKIIAIVLILIAVAVTAAGFILLPDRIITQVDFHGNPSTTMPKVLGLGVALLLTVIGAVGYLSEKNQKPGSFLLLAAAGIVVNVLMLIINLKR